MWYLYLDESGDLGFDFVNKKPSKFFIISILLIKGTDTNKAFIKAVEKTLARKLNRRGRRKRIVQELKGTDTILDVKKYFYNQIKDCDFNIYSLALNKRRLYEQLADDQERVYNYIARLVVDKIPFEAVSASRIEFIFDKCKAKPEIERFNKYIRSQLGARIDPKIPLDMYHHESHENRGLQACDLFCWGIFQKYERKNIEWIDVFKSKISYDSVYLPEK